MIKNFPDFSFNDVHALIVSLIKDISEIKAFPLITLWLLESLLFVIRTLLFSNFFCNWNTREIFYAPA